MQKTFGPVVIYAENDPEFRAKCLHQGYYCIFAVGGVCTHVADREDRKIPADNATPDWCEMKQNALDDARAMAAEQGDI